MKLRISIPEASSKTPRAAKLLDELLRAACEVHASDVHLEPYEHKMHIRFRVDGLLEEVCVVPHTSTPELISRIKVLAQLRTDEHQLPQDGRFQFEPVDVRVSIAPTLHGENAVLRLLSRVEKIHTLETLGFSKVDREKIERTVSRSSGMILVTGPTGSGKTTTLYTLIHLVQSAERSLVTIEDPVEYAVSGITQMQIHARAGFTFATGLRAILRQDPNVIMVGEIRDTETAAIAVNAALSGHLLLSTLHTANAPGAVSRLLDFKIEPFLVAGTLSLVIAQRLVRRLCVVCKKKVRVESEWFYEKAGCEVCGGSGYSGRISVSEVLEIDQNVRQDILSRATMYDLMQTATTKGMQRMFEDGLQKARDGHTSVSEVLRVLHEN
jgi:type II secretory ATPase GspE/PulE/Tfp pilus assembly ATPase PilB-like protein